MRFDLVIFDLDGTLVDSLPDIAAALNTGLGELGRGPLSPAQVRALVGEGVVRLADKALAVTGGRAAGAEQALALAARVRAIYQAHPCVASATFPEIGRTLDALKVEGGRRLAVLTNKPAEVTRPLLAALGIAGQFDAIVGDGDGHPRKPDPAAARWLIGQFGTTAARSLVVGDGLPDLAVARAVPCPVAAALWGYTPPAELQAQRPDFQLRSPAELLSIV